MVMQVYIKSNVPFSHAKTVDTGYFLKFSDDIDFVEFQISTSLISRDQLKLNYRREIENQSFEHLQQQLKYLWLSYFNVIDIKEVGNYLSEQQHAYLETFYSALYRTLLYPRVLREKNAEEKILDILVSKTSSEPTRENFRQKLRSGELAGREVEIPFGYITLLSRPSGSKKIWWLLLS
jgi:putative alpha-1,2-mannosidase